MYLVLSLFITISIIVKIFGNDEENLYFKYDGMEQVTTAEKYFNVAFEIRNLEGSDTIILIDGSISQEVELDNDWKTEVTVYRSDTNDGEYSKYISFPSLGVCVCLNTMYKKYFYDNLKDCSNLPPPDKCPLPKMNYWLKDCQFDAKVFKHASKPGFYKIAANLLYNNDVKTGVIVNGSVAKI